MYTQEQYELLLKGLCLLLTTGEAKHTATVEALHRRIDRFNVRVAEQEEQINALKKDNAALLVELGHTLTEEQLAACIAPHQNRN